jgi:hypothetical protein
MANGKYTRMCAIILYIMVAFTGLGISVWLGVANLVPQKPFVQRDIATGICLIVFGAFIGMFVGLIGAAIGFVLGLALDLCDEMLLY